MLAAVSYRYLLPALGGYLVRSDPPAHADAVVVLGGDYLGNRILKAGELVRQGFAPVALVGGAVAYEMRESDLAIAFATRHGYPASYFSSLPNETFSTGEEADRGIAELRRRHAQRADIVTSNYHTRRAGNIFRSKAHDLEFHIIAAPDPDFTPDGWWKNRQGRKILAMEWAKTVATWIGL